MFRRWKESRRAKNYEIYFRPLTFSNVFWTTLDEHVLHIADNYFVNVAQYTHYCTHYTTNYALRTTHYKLQYNQQTASSYTLSLPAAQIQYSK